MSFKVVAEVLEKSQARGTDRLVLVAIAECAWHDGVTWLKIGSSEYERKTICASARCSKREAIRAVQVLRDELREVETRKVRRGRSFITVYRVVVGRIAQETVDYDRMPAEIVPTPRFLEGDELARWIQGEDRGETASRDANDASSQGDDLAPSSHDVTVTAGEVHGASNGAFKVTDTRARVERTTREPSDDRSPSEPSSTEGEEQDLDANPRVRLLARARMIRQNLKRSACEECGVGGGHHTVDCGAARETARQAYTRFVDETANDATFPLAEIQTVISTWDDLDDVDRQELLERAERIRGGLDETAAGKAAAA